MKNLENSYRDIDKVHDNNIIDVHKNHTVNRVNQTLWENVSNNLAELFWLSKEHLAKLTKNKTEEISDENEINIMEAQLAIMFWKYDKIVWLNKTNENKRYNQNDIKINKKEPLSMASVLSHYDSNEDFLIK